MDPAEQLLQLLQELDKDDGRGSTRAKLASLCEKTGHPRDAAHWYLAAARHAEWSEQGLIAVAMAGAALRADPTNRIALAAYSAYWERFGGPGPPPPVSTP